MEFLTDLTELSVRAAVARATGQPDDEEAEEAPTCRPPAARGHPMLNALLEYGYAWPSPAWSSCRCGPSPKRPPSAASRGGSPLVEIMVPVVGAVQEASSTSVSKQKP